MADEKIADKKINKDSTNWQEQKQAWLTVVKSKLQYVRREDDQTSRYALRNFSKHDDLDINNCRIGAMNKIIKLLNFTKDEHEPGKTFSAFLDGKLQKLFRTRTFTCLYLLSHEGESGNPAHFTKLIEDNLSNSHSKLKEHIAKLSMDNQKFPENILSYTQKSKTDIQKIIKRIGRAEFRKHLEHIESMERIERDKYFKSELRGEISDFFNKKFHPDNLGGPSRKGSDLNGVLPPYITI